MILQSLADGHIVNSQGYRMLYQNPMLSLYLVDGISEIAAQQSCRAYRKLR